MTTIWDGAIQLDGPHPIFGENQTQEDVAKLAEENHLPGSRMEISFTPVIVNTGREVIMFDSGNGNGRRPNAGHLAEALGRAGFTPDQIDIVVLTHFHPDHVGLAGWLQERTISAASWKAEVHCSRTRAM